MFRLVTGIALWALFQTGFAQTPGKPKPAAPASPTAAPPAPQEDPLGRDTPYGCVRGFLTAASRGEYARAAEYLDTRANRSRAEEVARQLGVVLDFGLPGNLAKVSRSPEADQLAATRQTIGTVKTSSGDLDIVLERVDTSDKTYIWLFSPETLRRIPKVYAEISTPATVRRLPAFLRDSTLLSIPLWRWASAILGIVVALALASILTRALIPVIRPLVRAITGERNEARVRSLRGPVRLALLAGAALALSSLGASLLARASWARVGYTAAIIALAWLVMGFSDIFSDLRTRKLRSSHAENKLAVLALGRRLFKVLVAVAAAVLLLNYVGVNVATLLTGLGVGGVALAFGAQRTLENLLSGVVLILRETMHVGDLCKVADQMGFVEDIGFGFTQIRTFDRTVVTLPNAKIAQNAIENINRRDKFWFHHAFGLRYDTSPEQMRSVLRGIRELMRNDAAMEKESQRARFIGFGPSSLNIEAFGYIRAKDYMEYLRVQEDLLLHVMDIVAESGAKVALPAQVTYLQRDAARAAESARPVEQAHR